MENNDEAEKITSLTQSPPGKPASIYPTVERRKEYEAKRREVIDRLARKFWMGNDEMRYRNDALLELAVEKYTDVAWQKMNEHELGFKSEIENQIQWLKEILGRQKEHTNDREEFEKLWTTERLSGLSDSEIHRRKYIHGCFLDYSEFGTRESIYWFEKFHTHRLLGFLNNEVFTDEKDWIEELYASIPPREFPKFKDLRSPTDLKENNEAEKDTCDDFDFDDAFGD